MTVRRTIAGLAVCLLTVASTVLSPTIASAAPTSVNAYVAVGGSCVSTVNSVSGKTYADVSPGSNVTLVVTNQDGLVAQSVSGPGIPSGAKLQPAGTKTGSNQASFNLGVINGAETISFKPVPAAPNHINTDYCPTSSHPTASNLVINPVSATLTCSLNGSNWILSGNLSGNTSGGVGIYTGSTKVGSLNKDGTISDQLASDITDQAYAIVDGLNYSGSKVTTLASANCPGTGSTTAVASPPATTTGPTTSTSSPSPVTVGTSSSTPISTNSAVSPVSAPAQPATSNVNSQTSGLGSNRTTMLIYTGTGLISAVVIVTVLASTGIWTMPRTLAANSWGKFSKFSRRRTLRKLP